jgi:outer membrane protein assembly factor BamB
MTTAHSTWNWLLIASALGGLAGLAARSVRAEASAAPAAPPMGSDSFRPAAGRPVGWRGDGTGRYPAADPVAKWSEKENVLWKFEVGAGQSSPIVVNQRVFITAEPDLLLCLDTETGRELWRKTHKFSDLPAGQKAKDPGQPNQYGDATPTPVSDGQRIWVMFGTGMVACYDLDGQRAWLNWHDLPQTTTYGRTASPVLVGERLLVHLGPLVCLEAATGKPLWTNEQAKATYGTPAPARIGGVDVVITPKGQVVRVADGKILAADLGNCMYPSPVVQDGVVYFIDSTMTAVRLPAQAADRIECQELWSAEIPGEIYASPLVHGGRIYVLTKAASYTVLDATTGKTLLTKTLEFPRADGPSIYPSLCLAGKHLFAGNDAGDTLLLEPGDQGVVSGSSPLPRGSGATPTFSGRRMFIRGGKALYCISGSAGR